MKKIRKIEINLYNNEDINININQNINLENDTKKEKNEEPK